MIVTKMMINKKIYNSNIDIKDADRNSFQLNNGILILSPSASYSLAKDCLKMRWPQDNLGKAAEMMIADSTFYSILYAEYVLRGRWPQDCEAGIAAEANIATDSLRAFEYCSDVIYDEWPKDSPFKDMAEMSIIEYASCACLYATSITHIRWPDTKIGRLAERKILEESHYRKTYFIKFEEQIIEDEREFKYNEEWWEHVRRYGIERSEKK